MTELLQQARVAGIELSLAEGGRLSCRADSVILSQWSKTLRENRDVILDALRLESANEAEKNDFLTDAEAAILAAWLLDGGDTIEGAKEVIECCRRDTQAKEFFLREAEK